MKKSSIRLPRLHLSFYIPIIVLVIYSFNSSRFSTNWQGFTLDWYRVPFSDGPHGGLRQLLIIALVSSTIVTVLGTLGAFAFYRYRFLGRWRLRTRSPILMMSPDIVMGISLLMFFITIGLSVGAVTCSGPRDLLPPFVIVTVHAHQRVRPPYHRCSQRSGASELQMFRHVMLPMLMPAIIAGWLLSLRSRSMT